MIDHLKELTKPHCSLEVTRNGQLSSHVRIKRTHSLSQQVLKKFNCERQRCISRTCHGVTDTYTSLACQHTTPVTGSPTPTQPSPANAQHLSRGHRHLHIPRLPTHNTCHGVTDTYTALACQRTTPVTGSPTPTYPSSANIQHLSWVKVPLFICSRGSSSRFLQWQGVALHLFSEA